MEDSRIGEICDVVNRVAHFQAPQRLVAERGTALDDHARVAQLLHMSLFLGQAHQAKRIRREPP